MATPHAVRTWRATWQGRCRVALNEANRAVKDWEVRVDGGRGFRGGALRRRGRGSPRPTTRHHLFLMNSLRRFLLPSLLTTHTQQTAVREGGLAIAGVGNAAMQEE